MLYLHDEHADLEKVTAKAHDGERVETSTIESVKDEKRELYESRHGG